MTRRLEHEEEAMPEIKSGMAFLSKTGKAGRTGRPHPHRHRNYPTIVIV